MLQVEVGGRMLGRGSGATWDDAKQQVSLLVQHISDFETSLSLKSSLFWSSDSREYTTYWVWVYETGSKGGICPGGEFTPAT